MSITIQIVILIVMIGFTPVFMYPTTTPHNTTRNGSYSTPSNYYIISTFLIVIIILILLYFCFSDASRHTMFALLYWVFLLIVKILMFIPAILILLYCYIYKAFVFIGKKINSKLHIDAEVELQNSVVIINTDATTDTNTDTTIDTTIDTITETIGFILYCYSCSGLMYPFSRH
jgi:hypothetical protein